MTSISSLAFLMPQFREIEDNNRWWGQGFTEWTHLRNARTWSRGQVIRRPMPPLGEYMLLDPGVLEAHWALASAHGISAFAVWDYWLGGGKQLLERPIELVRKQRLKFNYCLSWANHSWTDKARNRVLCKQEYLGAADFERYFMRCLQHFELDNYLKIEGKPVFLVLEPHGLPHWKAFFEQWRELAARHGFPDMFFIVDRVYDGDGLIDSVDGYANGGRFLTRRNKLGVSYVKEHVKRRLGIELGPLRYDFRRFEKDIVGPESTAKFAPSVFTGWDTTPRHGRAGAIYDHLDPASFRRQLDRAAAHFARYPRAHHVLLIKSWNEWAEGNVFEPDSVWGDAFLRTFDDFVRDQNMAATDGSSSRRVP